MLNGGILSSITDLQAISDPEEKYNAIADLLNRYEVPGKRGDYYYVSGDDSFWWVTYVEEADGTGQWIAEEA